MMQKTKFTRILSLILCMVLAAALTLTAVGCGEEKTMTVESITDGETYGEGANSFAFTVTDKDGNSVSCTVKTDKTIVGDALTELGLIAGDPGPYGLYVKLVNGITAEYETTGTYWAFYIGDEYASTGVDVTPITEGASYTFKVES